MKLQDIMVKQMPKTQCYVNDAGEMDVRGGGFYLSVAIPNII